MPRPSEKLTPEEVRELEEEYYEVAQADDDGARARAREISQRLRRVGQHVRCGKEPMVDIDVPLGPDKGPDGQRRPLRINRKAYVGQMRVPLCIAKELLRLIDHAWRIDAERMREGGMTVNIGSIARDGTFTPESSPALTRAAARILADD